jgi:hypothetical protein
MSNLIKARINHEIEHSVIERILGYIDFDLLQHFPSLVESLIEEVKVLFTNDSKTIAGNLLK